LMPQPESSARARRMERVVIFMADLL
jgi:hypothetical protein